MDTPCAADDDPRCQSKDDAVFDDADHSVQLPLQLFRIVDRAKGAVQDVVAAIGEKRLSLTCRLPMIRRPSDTR
jgi:hypothetical protein